MEQATHARLYGYGVWRAPVLIDGSPAIWAVDSFGTVRKMRRIKPDEDEEEIGEQLWEWLLTHHPQRKLELVRDGEPELVRDSASRRMLDARLLTDPRSPLAKRRYVDRLVANASGRARRFREDR